MVWNPKQPVTNIKPLSPNLLTFFRARQTEALNWTHGGPGLVDFQVFYNTNEGLIYQIFPNVQILRERAYTRYTDSGQKIEYSFELLYEATGADATQLRVEEKERGHALESMVVNIPAETLMNGIGNYSRLSVSEITTEHGPLRGEKGNWLIASTMRAKLEFTEN